MQPAGDDGVRIREVVDQDFGDDDRHGYERIIPNDFGEPIDIDASSPDANADIDVDDGRDRRTASASATPTRRTPASIATSSRTRCRTHSCRRASSRSTSSATEPEEFETDRFEIVVTGLRARRPDCATSGTPAPPADASLARDGDVYRAVISPLKPGEGITIGGTITGRHRSSTSRRSPTPQAPTPTIAACWRWRSIPLGLVSARLGVRGRPPAWPQRGVRRRGRRCRVRRAAEARAATADRRPACALVADDKMDELATIEFVPPKGIEPWQGAVLLTRADRRRHRRGVVLGTRRQGGDHARQGGRRPRPSARARSTARARRRHEAAHIDRCSTTRTQSSSARTTRTSRRVEPDVRTELATSIADVGLVEAPSARARRSSGRRGGRDASLVIARPVLLRRRVVHRRPARAVRQRRRWPCVRDPRAGDLRPLPVPRVCCRVRSATGSALALAHRVVPAVPRGQRRPARRLGVEAGPAPRVQRMGGGARRRGCVGQGAQQEQRAAAGDAALASPMLIYSMGSSFDSTRTAPSSSGLGRQFVQRRSPAAASAAEAEAAAPDRGEPGI